MLINFNHLKTFYKAIIQKMKGFRGNWNQNDPTADDYIKNRPFYSEGIKEQTVVLVDNLTSDVDSDYYPSCNFVPGQSYTVTYNGVTYSDLVCYRDGSYNVICDQDKGYPCYIDDNGGNGLYIGANDDNWTISIATTIATEVIHKIDKKFIDLPNNIITEDDLAPVARSNDYWDLDNRPVVETSLDIGSYGAIANTTVTNALNEKLSITPAELPARIVWQDICCADGTYIAIAGGHEPTDCYAYSYDGEHWSGATLPSVQPWHAICNGNGTTVITAGTSVNSKKSNVAAYSTNGSTWHQTELPVEGNWGSVCYGNGMFIAVNKGTSDYAYSYDGINWQEGSFLVGTTSGGYGIALFPASVHYAKDKFIVVSEISSNVYEQFGYSYDGLTWYQTPAPCEASWQSVCYGNGKFVAMAKNSHLFAHSEDGIIWKSGVLANGGTRNIAKVCFGNGRFVAIEGELMSNTPHDGVYYSVDGIKWYANFMPCKAGWFAMCYGADTNIGYTFGGGSKFVAIAGGIISATTVASSPDGVTWSDKQLAETKQLVAAVQPYLYNDFAQLNDVYTKDETYSQAQSEFTVTWDGNMADRDYATHDTWKYYKVSDAILDPGAIVSVDSTEFGDGVISRTRGNIKAINEFAVVFGTVIIATKAGIWQIQDQTTSGISVLNVPAPGIYLAYHDASTYVSSATIYSNARAIPSDVVGVVRSINGAEPDLNGNIEVEAMSMEKIDEICV